MVGAYGNTPQLSERASYSDVILEGRVRATLTAINPSIPNEAIEGAYRKLTRAIHELLLLAVNNHQFYKMLTEGVDVEYKNSEGRIVGDKVWLVDFDNPDKNDWLAVNQFTVVEGQYNRRSDVVLFLNGLPLGVIELKNPADENATLKDAFRQFQTYKHEIPSLFPYNQILVISDGMQARVGTLTADIEWFLPWKTIEGLDTAPKGLHELEVLIKGVFEKQRSLDILRYFIVFEVDGPKITKKIAAYHQYHAVNRTVECTVKAVLSKDDRRVGVVWHTQGSGKRLTMAFYVGKIIQHPEMQNPTLVVLTDRNDLDDQLFGTFSQCKDLLRQTSVQAESREHFQKLLKVASGGVVFTTIQKFFHDVGATRRVVPTEKLTVIKETMEYILTSDDGRKRFMQAVTELSKSFALAVPHEQAIAIRDDVGFFLAIRAAFAKNTEGGGQDPDILDSAVRQIVSKAIASEEVIDIFASAGMKRPDISILSDEFLEEVGHMPQKNLALEVLKKLLNNEIKVRIEKYLVQSRYFSEMLEQTIKRYQSRTIEAAQVISELIELAKEMREAHKRGEKLNNETTN